MELVDVQRLVQVLQGRESRGQSRVTLHCWAD